MLRHAIACVCMFLPAVAGAQGPAPGPSCEDQLRTYRVLTESLSTTRARGEVEAAQAIAGLLKRVADLERQLKGASKPAEVGPEPPRQLP